MYLAGPKKDAIIGVGLNFVPGVGPLLSTGWGIFGGKKSQDQKNAEFSAYATKDYDPTVDWEGYLYDYPDVLNHFNGNVGNAYNLFGGNSLAWAAYHYKTAGKKEGRRVYPVGQHPKRLENERVAQSQAEDAARQQAEANQRAIQEAVAYYVQPQTLAPVDQQAPAPANPVPVVQAPQETTYAAPSPSVAASCRNKDNADYYCDETNRWINRHTGYPEAFALSGLDIAAMKMNGLTPQQMKWLGSHVGRAALKWYGDASSAIANRMPGNQIRITGHSAPRPAPNLTTQSNRNAALIAANALKLQKLKGA